jgi:Domain of unknown function (DUF3885)
MNLRAEIEQMFHGRAFMRPLFYAYPGGLRFELSEGGHVINQLMTAHRKALAICSDIFTENADLTVCLRVHLPRSRYLFYRRLLGELAAVGIKLPRSRSVWVEDAAGDNAEDEVGANSLCIAFSPAKDSLTRLLWCALSTDLGVVHPRQSCTVYLFHLSAGIVVLPYDDRGMDVVGPNAAMLAHLYRTHHARLNDYDRAVMAATFEPPTAQKRVRV